MKKTLTTIFLTILVICLSIYFSYVFRVPLLNRSLTTLFDVPVKTSLFNFSKNEIEVESVTINNPKPSDFPYAMYIENIKIVTPVKNYFQNNTEIRDIIIDNVDVNIEFYDKGNKQMNWDPIVASSNYIIASPLDEDGPVITVQKFVITRLNVHLKQAGKKVETFHFSGPLVYQNLDSRRGIPSRVIGDIIVRITLQKVFSLGGLTEFAGSLFKGTIKPITEILPFHFSEKKRKPLQ